MIKFRVTTESKNKKTGRIPVTTTSADSCPPTCPFREAGCYAKGGPLAIVWRQVDDIGITIKEFCQAIASFPVGTFWRHNQAGDLPGVGEAIDTEALGAIVKANKGRRGFTYTHKNPFVKRNASAIRKANRDGFTINLSGNNLEHADTLANLEIAPVVSVLPKQYERASHKGKYTEPLAEYRKRVRGLTTPQGKAVAICPATYMDTNCKACQLCQRQRDVIVGFPAHGVAHKKASAIAA